MISPPEPFALPVIICPSCGHGIDPHGLDPGGPCAADCLCLWSPNDIAATVIAESAQAVRMLFSPYSDPKAKLGYWRGINDAARVFSGAEAAG